MSNASGHAHADHTRVYRGIIKSASLLGSARLINVAIGLVRVKIVATVLGPAGTGSIGSYEILLQLAVMIAGLGVATSGVREIAALRSIDCAAAAARAALHLHRVSIVLGGLGAIALLLFASPLAALTFGDPDRLTPFLYLAPCVWMVTISCASRAVLQGTHQIRNLAISTALSAAWESLVTISLVLQFREQGILPALLLGAVGTMAISRWFETRQRIPIVHPSWRDTFKSAPTFIKLGIGLTSAILLSYLVMYATRTLVSRDLGVEALGIYLCGFALSDKFIGFLIDSMRGDFYPKLSAVAHDRLQLNLLVNQQTEIVLLLALPGLLFTMALAPVLVDVLYSPQFASASDLVRLFTLGCLGRAITAPMGFVRLAQGKGLLYFGSELALCALHFGFIFAGLNAIGLEGIGFAYIAFQFCRVFALQHISRKHSEFRWSRPAIQLIALSVPLAVGGSVIGCVMPRWPATLILGLLSIGATVFSLRRLCGLLGPEHRITRLLLRPSLAWLFRMNTPSKIHPA